jgi:hypothetical protein
LISRNDSLIDGRATADLQKIWTGLGIPADYATARGLTFQPEAAELISIGTDIHNRGFRLSYPRTNAHRIIYEPWHWCWQEPAAGGAAAPTPQ